jgi:hypothetical protein
MTLNLTVQAAYFVKLGDISLKNVWPDISKALNWGVISLNY